MLSRLKMKPFIPTDILRTRLENARLDLLALFRALDRMDLRPVEIPQKLLRQLFELDADYAEGLWALDRRLAGPLSKAKLHDILTALEELPERLAQFRKALAPRAHSTLPALEQSVRQNLDPREAYNMVPGRDPQIR